MNRALKITLVSTLLLLVAAALGLGGWYVITLLPQRSGQLPLAGLQQAVTVRYDERGVPHIRAENPDDLYRTLGWVHAQDRLFQMEMMRRLAKGELAEILGPKLVDVDKLFRTLGLRARAQSMAQQLDPASPSTRALQAYLDGINQYQRTRPRPLEFDLLGIPRKPFTPEDTLAVAGYLAYSFAAAFRTEPVMTYIRDKLGQEYLKTFDLDWHPEGVLNVPRQTSTALTPRDWESLARVAQLSADVSSLAGVPLLEGSNAWAISAARSASKKPLLAGDPHIAFAVPAVWYEAHLSAPGIELYGNFQALIPSALLGHNHQFGWSLTMFQNDDMDLVAERVNPANPNQVWHQGRWLDYQMREENIPVKGAAPVRMTVRMSPRGPIINDVFKDGLGTAPIALWWTFLDTDNPILDAFYGLNRADTLAKAREAVQGISAPGLNVVWANASGDIGWWAAAKLPVRPPGVNPAFILDAARGEADKLGYYRFGDNPQEENPPRGFVVSANHQPRPSSGVPVPGYYNLSDRAQQLYQRLRPEEPLWDTAACQALQLDDQSPYSQRVLQPLIPVLNRFVTIPVERAMLESMAGWDGHFTPNSVTPTLFTQLLYEIAQATMADRLGPAQFKNLLGTRVLDDALARLARDPDSPWWRRPDTPPNVDPRADTLQKAWRATIAHLTATLDSDPAKWSWGRAHTLKHGHPLGRQAPLDLIFDVGPFAAPSGRELPNNLGYAFGPAPWAVTYGPSTRRVIDFAKPQAAQGINPVGQSGVVFDRHYADQAEDYIRGKSQPMHLDEADIASHTRGTLVLRPAPASAP